jgi:hypothetical protein
MKNTMSMPDFPSCQKSQAIIAYSKDEFISTAIVPGFRHSFKFKLCHQFPYQKQFSLGCSMASI